MLLGAKLVATVPLGLLYGVVGTAGLVAGSAPLLASLGRRRVPHRRRGRRGPAARRRRAAALWAVLGVAFGSVVPNQVAAIVVILAFTQLVEPIARLALGAFDPTDGGREVPARRGRRRA